MAGRRDRLQQIMTQPIVMELGTALWIYTNTIINLASIICLYLTIVQNQIFRFFTSGTRVQIWLFDQPNMKIEGKIRGFDEYMNMVLDEVEELYVKKQERRALGTILLKGEAMALIAAAP